MTGNSPNEEEYSFSGPYALDAAKNALAGIPVDDIASIEICVVRDGDTGNGKAATSEPANGSWDQVEVDKDVAEIRSGTNHEDALRYMANSAGPVRSVGLKEADAFEGGGDNSAASALSQLYRRGLAKRRPTEGRGGGYEYLPTERGERALARLDSDGE